MPKRYYFYIGSIETFERQMEEAQRELGKDPQDFVPVIYAKENEYM
jgi:AFG3 family protein